MSRKIFKRILIICITAFIMAILAVVLCANYLLSYKPTVGDNDKNTYIVTDEKGNRKVITLENKEGNYNFLVLGHDRAALLTDVIMLINYDITDSKVTIMQFPRDTYVSYGVPTSKINATFSTYYSQALNEGKSEEEARMSGLREFGDILEEALGINIYKCAIMNLDGFVNIVDALGGVEMNVPYRLNYSDPGQNLYIDLYPGYQTLTGAEAEQFVRFRHGYLQADIGRQNAQKMFMSAFIQKAKSSLNISNVGTLTTVATEIIDNLTTDITVSDFVYFAKEMLGKVDLSNIKMLTVPGEPLSNEYGWSYYVLNRQSLHTLVNEYFNTSDTKEIPLSIFDSQLYFTDTASSIFTNSYYSTDVPPINEEFDAKDIIDNSIDIPMY